MIWTFQLQHRDRSLVTCKAASRASNPKAGGQRSSQPSRKPANNQSKDRSVSSKQRKKPTAASPAKAVGSKRPSRVTAPNSELGCPHFASCSGCTIEENIEKPPLADRASTFFSERGIQQFNVTCTGIHNWRCRARLAVRGTPGKATLGLFKEGSHEVVDIPNCRVHHPRITQAVRLLQQLISACRIEPYTESSSAGQLRYVQLTALPSPGQKRAEDDPDALVQVVLVWNSRSAADPSFDHCRRLAQQLWLYAGASSGAGSRTAVSSPLLSAIWANFNDAAGNTILGRGGFELLHGQQQAWQQFGDCDASLGPGSFVQVNYSAMQACLQAMAAWVPQGAAVTELYAGVGVIGLHLAATRQLRSLRCVEVNQECLEPFRASRARLAPELAIAYDVAAAEDDPAGWISGADVVVMDPPRKGLDVRVLQALTDPKACSASRLLYLSCGYHALEREADVLLGSGLWRLAHAEALLFFPGTDSLETLAVFDRV